jgi:hypothetical protein
MELVSVLDAHFSVGCSEVAGGDFTYILERSLFESLYCYIIYDLKWLHYLQRGRTFTIEVKSLAHLFSHNSNKGILILIECPE